MTKDPLFLRKQFLIMARNTYTPVTVWMDMPLMAFVLWVRASNELNSEKKK